MIYQICEFEMNQHDCWKVTLNKKGNKSYIEYNNGDGWKISETIDDDEAKLVYMQIVSLMIDGMYIDLDQFGIF